ncbi:hypothetical protein SCP_0700150 [Sparassis crispa]|uniref:Uncharacterized protein n=1 Tax=Sparassis crispa TaxID=139825 RepID=A0A401GRI9_9APHY|nr:hypothetical protein SCP_0700150 [Sparassis crispa]GBE84835.1 hypothetical protein SCP_0700150 [Sparassis crispa]
MEVSPPPPYAQLPPDPARAKGGASRTPIADGRRAAAPESEEGFPRWAGLGRGRGGRAALRTQPSRRAVGAPGGARDRWC